MDISKSREEIDKIDEQLTELLTKRMHLSKDVAEYKLENGMNVTDSRRERNILSQVSAETDNDLVTFIQSVYASIFDASRSYQNRFINIDSGIAEDIENAEKNTDKLFPAYAVVACQGIEGSNSNAAADKLFRNPGIMYFNSFEGVFAAVSKGMCKYGILPIENSTAGSVNEVYDLMRKNKFYIVRAIKLKIDHKLLAKHGVKMNEITEIYSHEQAIEQCSDFLKEAGVKVTACENTALAAKKVSESSRRDIAALADVSCADLYNLSVVENEIMNSDNNYTRFICISKNLEIYPGADKISLMLTLPHKPGTLNYIISRFATLGLNLTKLESRPIAGKDFEFMFYFDVQANIASKDVLNLIAEFDREIDNFSYLGSYSEIV